jgi:hypothetical protein
MKQKGELRGLLERGVSGKCSHVLTQEVSHGQGRRSDTKNSSREKEEKELLQNSNRQILRAEGLKTVLKKKRGKNFQARRSVEMSWMQTYGRAPSKIPPSHMGHPRMN